ncbi:ABC transporter ATP-binding protein [Estrella lausannensis]|uniref:ABC-type transporter, ATPase subunit n=1 Tax=Estrella lausannensis TaxID=483423 RepID=A0A0H5E5K9_9BACT|nr:ABC transporter ATP-binding protein [Estrella lausannensis]CRX38520.1 ABC-type transporter, ATPase subunit [Estrella lausannensis]
MPESTPLLDIRNLSYTAKKKKIIKSITFAVHHGETLTVLGPNGSGKSTLLRLIGGLITPSAGDLFYRGGDLHAMPRKELSKTVSLVPQTPSVQFEFSAAEIVSMGAFASSKKLDPIQLEDVMTRLKIYHLKDMPIQSLSAGERQRCYIARTLLADSPLMMLDEPMSFQDVLGRNVLKEEIKRLKTACKTLIITSHDFNFVKALSDRCLLLDKGDVKYLGRHEPLFAGDLIAETFGIDS